MTGHQPTPSTGKTAMGAEAKIIRIQDAVKGLGIEKIEVIDPFDVKSTIKTLKEIMKYNGPSVIISQRPCPLLIDRQEPREVLEKCNACGVCVKAFGCPAISMSNERAKIDTTLCYGCGVCETVCPFEAIRKREK
jgi:indolepyruvate ferredoxin oxidoreductase alpha subunit